MSTPIDPLMRVAYRGAYHLALAWWFVRRPHTEGSLVGVWRGREVLLLQNSYKHAFSLPGGGRHRGESPEETGSRELREEVGLHVPAAQLRFVSELHHTDEFKKDRCHFVEVELDTEPRLVLDQREVVWARWIDVETALRLPLMPVVRAYLEDAARRRGFEPSRSSP